jgi:hypothetical protein
VAAAPAALAANFSPEDATALRTANAAYRDYKHTWRDGTIGKVLQSATTDSGFKMPSAAVGKALFRPGPAGATAADDLIKAAGSPEAAAGILGDYPAYAFRRAAERDGTIDPKLAQKWIDAHKDTLEKFPGVAERFKSAADATRAWQETAAKAQDAIKAYQDSAAGHYLNKGGEAVEPQAAVAKLFASPTAGADAAALMRQVKGNAAAADGIKRNLVDYLIQRTRSQAEAGTTGQKEIAGATFQKFTSDAKNAAVIRAVLGEDGAKMVQAIGKDIEQASRSVNATKIPGSPGTAADLHALAEHGASPSVVGQVVVGEALGEAAGHLLHAGGPVGTAIRIGTTAATIIAQALRTAGLKKVDDLATYGVLNPEIGRLLLSKVKVTPRAPILKTLVGRIGQIGLGAAATSHAQ